MSVVDNRVVKMVFDNAGFEKNVGTTLSTLEKLKQALHLEGAVQGLQNLSNAAKNVSFDSLSNGIITVQSKFDALDIVAYRVLQNITDMAFNAGKTLAEQLTIAPLKAGLQEYETQINAIQTILANTGDALIEKGFTTEHDRIEKVNEVLDELNHYADMTIYNFTEMTRNIGTFTAAGVDLDTAAKSIQGIANLAAMSGSNSQQASTAMYQLSQAIAAGSVKLMDWNSVVNAGMGGKLFQNELIDTAKAMGVADEQFVKLTEGAITFRESLSSGWITSEVLTNTLEKFTAGSEGYTKSQIEQMQRLWKARGYSEEQIKELTGSVTQLTEEQEKNLRTKWAEKGFSDEQIDHILSMGTAATDAATKVKTFSQLLETVGEALQSGWTQSWEYIIGDFEQAKMLWTEISDILNLYIGKSADARNEVLKEWSRAAYSYNENGELIKLTYDEAGNLIKNADAQVVQGGKMLREEMGGRELVIQSLRNTFQGLFEVAMEFGKSWNIGFWGKGTQNDISITGQKLRDLSLALYDFTTNFKNAFQRNKSGEAIGLLKDLRDAFTKFSESIRSGYDGIKGAFSGISNILVAFFRSSFFDIGSLNSIIAAISTVTDRVKEFGNAIRTHFGNDSSGKNREGLIRFFSGLQGIIESAAWVKINFIANAFDALGSIIEQILPSGETIATLLGKLGIKFTMLSNGINAFFNENGVSKFNSMFKGIADSIANFINGMKDAGVIDFSGIRTFFNQLIGILNGSMGDQFSIITNFFTALSNIFKTLVGLVGPVADAFAEIFGKELVSAVSYLGEFVSRFRDLTEAFVPSQSLMQGIKTLFEGIFSVVAALAHVVGDTFLAAWDGLGKIFATILPTGKDLGDMLSTLGNYLKRVSESIRDLTGNNKDLPTFTDVISKFSEKIAELIKSVKDAAILKGAGEIIKNFFANIKEALFGSSDITILEGIILKLKELFKTIKDVITDGQGLNPGDVIGAGVIGVIILKLTELLKGLYDTTKGAGQFVKTISEIGDSIAGLIGSITGAGAEESTIKQVAKSLLMIAGAVFIISIIDPVSLAKAIAAISYLFTMIQTLVNGINNLDKGSLASAAGAITALGTALLMLSVGVYILGNMNLVDLAKGMVAVVLMLNAIVVVAKEFSTFEKDLVKGAGQLILMAIAIDLLAISVKTLGNMDFESMAHGLLGTIALIFALARASEMIGKDFSFGDAAGLLAMAIGLRILASAVTEIGSLDLPSFAIGMAGVALSLGLLIVAVKALTEESTALAQESTSILAIGEALLLLSISIRIMASAIKTLGSMDFGSLVQGLLGLAAGLAAMVIAVKEMVAFGSAEAAMALAALAAAILPLAIAIKIMGSLNFGQVATGLIALGGALAIFIIAANAITPVVASGMLALAGAIALVGAGMLAFGVGLTAIGLAVSTSGTALLWFLEQLITFLPQAATAFANAIGAFLAALANNASTILQALTSLLGAALGAIQAVLPQIFEIVRTVIDQILQTLIAEIPRVFEVLGVFFEQLWGFLATQVPNFFAFLTTFFTELFTFLQTEGPMLIETIRLMLDTVLQAIIAEAPVFAEAFTVLIMSALTTIQTIGPELITTLLQLLTDLLTQLATFTPQMAQAAMDILLAFLNTVANNIQQITESAISIAVAFINGIAEKLPEVIDAAFNLIIQFIDGLATAIDNNHNALFDAIGHLIESIVNAVKDGIGRVGNAAGDLVVGPGGIVDSLGGFVHDLFDAGANLVQGFIDGLVSMPGRVWDAACGIARDAWNAITGTLDEHSPSRLTFGGGVNFVLGFVNGIDDRAALAASASASMAYGAISAFDDAIGSGIDKYAPTITPVVNAPVIQGGLIDTQSINDILSSADNIDANLNMRHSMDEQILDAINVNSDYSSILSEMGNLRSDLSTFANSISKMQVIMDSGVLVGMLTPGIDRALGIRQNLSERGVI